MPTETQVNNMIEVQDRLNCHLNPQWCSAGYDWSLAIMSECTELADQIGWKWWKHQPQAPLTQIHLEVVDIWHFVLSGLIEQGAMDLIRREFARPDVSPGAAGGMTPRAALSAAKNVVQSCDKFDLQLVTYFRALMHAVRLSTDDLYDLYMAKAALNLFRWDNGYREGTYIKQWGDVEDNVYLESVLHGHPTLALDDITTLLRQRYTEVCNHLSTEE